MVADARYRGSKYMIETAFKELIEDKVLPEGLNDEQKERCKKLFFLGMQAMIHWMNEYPPIKDRIQAELNIWWQETTGE